MIIYVITNKINGMQYVGLTTVGIKNRWARHCKEAKICPKMYNAISYYGKDSFTIEQIDSAETMEELNSKEIYWIQKLNTLHPFGYNLTKGGSGCIPTKETKHKISIARVGLKYTEAQRKTLSLAQKEAWAKGSYKGRRLSGRALEQAQGIGRPHTEEAKQKISKIVQERYANGFKMSQGHINKLIASNKSRTGTKASPEVKKRLSSLAKTRWEEGVYDTRDYKHTEEVKAKMAQKRILYIERLQKAKQELYALHPRIPKESKRSYEKRITQLAKLQAKNP